MRTRTRRTLGMVTFALLASACLVAQPAWAAVTALRPLEQREVLVARDARGAQVVQDDEYWHGMVAGDHNRAGDSGFRVDSMVAFLPNQREPSQLKGSAETLVRDRSDARHWGRRPSERQLHLLSCDERWGDPAFAGGVAGHESFFAKDILQSSHPLALFEEESDGLRQPTTSFLDRIAAAGYPQLRAVADEGFSFLEDQRGKCDLVHGATEYSRATELSQTLGRLCGRLSCGEPLASDQL